MSGRPIPGPRRRLIRRLIRRLGVGVALLLVVALGAMLVLALYSTRRLERASARFEAVLGPLDLARFQKPAIPEAENAATWLVAGAGALVLADEEVELVRRFGPSAWSAEDAAEVERLVAANRPALELLRRALDCPASSYGIDYAAGPDAELPEMIELLGAGRLAWLDARLALAAGDGARFATGLAILGRLAGSLADESMVISSIVALGLDRYGFDLAHRALEAGVADPAALDGVERYVASIDNRREMALRALAAEGAMMASTPLLEVWMAGQDSFPARAAAVLGRPAHRLMVAGALEDYVRFATLIDGPFAELLEAERPPGRGLISSPLAGILYPNLVDWLGKLELGEALRQLAGEALRLWRLRLATGAWPDGFEPLAADPYAGRPVTVERRPDGTLVLEARGALELWRQQNPNEPFPGEPPLVWVLPAAPGS